MMSFVQTRTLLFLAIFLLQDLLFVKCQDLSGKFNKCLFSQLIVQGLACGGLGKLLLFEIQCWN